MDANGPGHLMLKEIREQPQAISRLIEAEEKRVWKMAKRWNEKPPRFISIAARGTSDHAALYGKYLFETANGIPVSLAAPSVISMYKADLRVEGALVIGISQSGEAADVAAVIEQAKAAGADTLAITNIKDSPLAKAAEQLIPLHAGAEKAVAATKTFTCSMAALLLLSAAISQKRELLSQLKELPSLVEEAVKGTEKLRGKMERFRNLQECVVLGRGYGMSVAYELALKLRETSYLRA
ncbi:MAG: SIS domain-containing protein, partial [Armatimonadetes bacterium]|nr:SIS domain-containing protein [Armatimonadota bacterium]NIO76947.1 SIS domain-containing protein [Armatimonadota bacterium]NIO97043.1 SIS domain-containing protein [Armatimonadota bacterium]